jgi:hypothetical protein
MRTTYRLLKSMDTAIYFQNGLAELIEIRYTVRSVEILSLDIFLNFLIVYYDTSL